MLSPEEHAEYYQQLSDHVGREMRKGYVTKLDLWDAEQRRKLLYALGNEFKTPMLRYGQRISPTVRSASQGDRVRRTDRIIGEAVAVELARLRDECARAAAAVSPEAEAAVLSVPLPEWKAIA